jgi:hypothetical protein
MTLFVTCKVDNRPSSTGEIPDGWDYEFLPDIGHPCYTAEPSKEDDDDYDDLQNGPERTANGVCKGMLLPGQDMRWHISKQTAGSGTHKWTPTNILVSNKTFSEWWHKLDVALAQQVPKKTMKMIQKTKHEYDIVSDLQSRNQQDLGDGWDYGFLPDKDAQSRYFIDDPSKILHRKGPAQSATGEREGILLPGLDNCWYISKQISNTHRWTPTKIGVSRKTLEIFHSRVKSVVNSNTWARFQSRVESLNRSISQKRVPETKTKTKTKAQNNDVKTKTSLRGKQTGTKNKKKNSVRWDEASPPADSTSDDDSETDSDKVPTTKTKANKTCGTGWRGPNKEGKCVRAKTCGTGWRGPEDGKCVRAKNTKATTKTCGTGWRGPNKEGKCDRAKNKKATTDYSDEDTSDDDSDYVPTTRTNRTCKEGKCVWAKNTG